ncbi:hypothetical protein E2542_SST27000 [Spatholobus suberectus]|nr:hypothetical protein E2542_SST27000 [Spatholobus suberectus]
MAAAGFGICGEGEYFGMRIDNGGVAEMVAYSSGVVALVVSRKKGMDGGKKERSKEEERLSRYFVSHPQIRSTSKTFFWPSILIINCHLVTQMASMDNTTTAPIMAAELETDPAAPASGAGVGEP